jgi:uncharacterized coiled-coil DUF342 family protein
MTEEMKESINEIEGIRKNVLQLNQEIKDLELRKLHEMLRYEDYVNKDIHDILEDDDSSLRFKVCGPKEILLTDTIDEGVHVIVSKDGAKGNKVKQYGETIKKLQQHFDEIIPRLRLF